MLLADHTHITDDDHFLLRPKGDPVDAQIIASSRMQNLQFTLAAPIWGMGSGPQQNSGYQHHQTMVALNQNEGVVGHPPFTYENGVAIGAVSVITSEERYEACRSGLSSAIANKALDDGRGCILVVFAQDFYFQLLDTALFQVLIEAVLNEHTMSFDSICVFDQQPGFFVERARRIAA
jgi:hypothetical protein